MTVILSGCFPNEFDEINCNLGLGVALFLQQHGGLRMGYRPIEHDLSLLDDVVSGTQQVRG